MAKGSAVSPARLMLATDLSGRGDRALDRAIGLANDWGAELVVVHALEEEALYGGGRDLPSWRRPPDLAGTVEQRILEDIRGPHPRLRFHVEDGAPLKVILDAVQTERPDLLIVAMGRTGAFGGMSRTVDELFRQSPSSMLVVKRRPNGPYGRLLVGTDYTDEAREGLAAAARLFPVADIAVMHAYDMPYRNLYLDPALAERYGAVEQETMATWLAETDLSADARGRITPLIEHGAPESMLAAYVNERAADLTVIGAYERGALFHRVIRGHGPRIVQSVASDVLVVRPATPAR